MDTTALCAPLHTFETEYVAEGLLGAPDTLCVALLQAGACHAVGAPPLLQPGSLLLAAGQAGILPQPACALQGVAVAGAAAIQLCQALPFPTVLPPGSVPEAPELLYRLAAEKGLDTPKASALCYTLLCAVAAAENTKSPALPPLVAEAIALIHQNYAEVYGVEELAAQTGVSKSHLVRSFTAAVGTSPGRYLSAVRVDAAKRLLLHREYPLEVVATLCGFSGANYLCKVFKKATGQSPAAWRLSALPQGACNTAPTPWEEQLYL